ncbi:MJ0042-type zinc finger domain-containing protein [Bdellovibrionota bacterium FG-1]
MRWNCPHCGTSLAISDEKIGNGWSFSRCYKCAGYGLIRRSDVNLIKVDRAPAGEAILLPEANEEPTAVMSRAATKHLSKIITPYSAQKVINQAMKPTMTQGEGQPPPTRGHFGLNLPAPLPDEPVRSLQQKALPLAIGLAGVLALGSGIYLYVEGQNLWAKAHFSPSDTTTTAANVLVDQVHSKAMAPSREADVRTTDH